MAQAGVDVDAFGERWQEWHRQHERRRARPHGFLAVTSLNFLTAAPERFPDAPGVWSSDDDGVLVVLAEGERLVLDGVAVEGSHRFGVIRDSVNVGWGEAVIEVARRGGFHLVRPRHPDHPLRINYRGTPTYPPDPRWAVPGRYVAFDTSVRTRVGTAVAGLHDVYEATGLVEFTVDGQPLALAVFRGDEPGSLSAIFTDLTSGITTYRANRTLDIGAPAADGSVVLDFNRAVNPPCAYTPYATCSLPPPQNRLPVAIEAGEKAPEPSVS